VQVDEEELEELDNHDISTGPTDYEEVLVSGACIILKTAKETDEKAYRYHYWQ
jgi:hypothetical protein